MMGRAWGMADSNGQTGEKKKGVSERESEVKASQAVQAAGAPTGRIQEVRLALVQSLSDQETRIREPTAYRGTSPYTIRYEGTWIPCRT